MTSTLRNLVLLLTFVAFFTACTKDPIRTVVSGQFTDTKTGKPVPNIEVTLAGYDAKSKENFLNGHQNIRNTKLVTAITDANGQYRLEFDAKADSFYRLNLDFIKGFSCNDDEYLRFIKVNETQTQNYSACFYAQFYLDYSGNGRTKTDSISSSIIRTRPCEDGPSTIDDSNFSNSLLASSSTIGGGVRSYIWVENNTVSTVKWQRFVKGKLVETQEKTVKSTIGVINSVLVEY
jgi:5-hydroxyisourate hydrolase-like protein (transthyretin family)